MLQAKELPNTYLNATDISDLPEGDLKIMVIRMLEALHFLISNYITKLK